MRSPSRCRNNLNIVYLFGSRVNSTIIASCIYKLWCIHIRDAVTTQEKMLGKLSDYVIYHVYEIRSNICKLNVSRKNIQSILIV